MNNLLSIDFINCLRIKNQRIKTKIKNNKNASYGAFFILCA